MTAWFPASRCLSAFLVSCKCCGKHTTLYSSPFAPHHPWCLLLKVSYSYHYIWLPANNSLNSVQNPFGQLIFFIKKMVSGCFSLYMHKNVFMYRRHCVYARYTHLSENLFGYLLKTHWKNNDKFIRLSRPGSQFLEYKICIKSFFALTVGTCSLQAEGVPSLCTSRVTGSLWDWDKPLSA